MIFNALDNHVQYEYEPITVYEVYSENPNLDHG